MTKQTTYIQPQIKIYSVNITEILSASDPVTKNVSVGGNDTETQLSKGGTLDFEEE